MFGISSRAGPFVCTCFVKLQVHISSDFWFVTFPIVIKYDKSDEKVRSKWQTGDGKGTKVASKWWKSDEKVTKSSNKVTINDEKNIETQQRSNLVILAPPFKRIFMLLFYIIAQKQLNVAQHKHRLTARFFLHCMFIIVFYIREKITSLLQRLKNSRRNPCQDEMPNIFWVFVLWLKNMDLSGTKWVLS